jgi:hypothetical protein
MRGFSVVTYRGIDASVELCATGQKLLQNRGQLPRPIDADEFECRP